MSLTARETESGIIFVFECEMCSSSSDIVIQTDIKPSEFKKFSKLKSPLKREITIHSVKTFEALEAENP